jgi:uncharacterized RDD family membrane protein YckC
MEDRISIETPEHVELSYELAGIGSRALACVVDSFVQFVLVALLLWALNWVGSLLKLPDLTGILLAVVMATATFMVTAAYYITCEMTMDGQSPGKRLAGLRVVRDDGTPITFTDSAVRNIVRLVDLLPGLYTVGLLVAFFSSQSKRLGDLAAGTIVVKERLYEAPAETAAEAPLTPPAGPGSPPETVTRLRTLVHLLSEAECAAAARFVQRRDELPRDVRAQMAQRLAEPLLARLPGVPAQDFADAEAFLQMVVSLRSMRF